MMGWARNVAFIAKVQDIYRSLVGNLRGDHFGDVGGKDNVNPDLKETECGNVC
jgi:hypothetical protein